MCYQDTWRRAGSGPRGWRLLGGEGKKHQSWVCCVCFLLQDEIGLFLHTAACTLPLPEVFRRVNARRAILAILGQQVVCKEASFPLSCKAGIKSLLSSMQQSMLMCYPTTQSYTGRAQPLSLGQGVERSCTWQLSCTWFGAETEFLFNLIENFNFLFCTGKTKSP